MFVRFLIGFRIVFCKESYKVFYKESYVEYYKESYVELCIGIL